MIDGREIVSLLGDPSSGFAITPILDADAQIGDASVDVRLGPDIIVSRRATGATAFDASDAERFSQSIRRRQTYVRRRLGDSFHLQPGEFVIARTLEYVTLSSDISAQALGRSSWGRLGLVVATATLVQPGFKGTITLELANVGNTVLVLQVGLPVAQLVFSRAAARPTMSARPGSRERRRTIVHNARVDSWYAAHKKRTEKRGRYVGQVKPAFSQLQADADLRWAAPLALRYILGVVGERYSGKSSVVDFLVARRGFRLYRMVHVVRDEAARRGVDPNDRKELRRFGDILRGQHGPDAIAVLVWMRLRQDLLDADRDREPKPVVVEGFKRPEELRAFQRLATFRTLVLDVDPEVRLARAEQGNWLVDEQRRARSHPPENVPGNEPARLEWLRRWVDEPTDGRYLMGPLIPVAMEDPQRLVIDNNKPGVPLLQDQLAKHLEALELAWRGGLFEPDPDTITARPTDSVSLPRGA